MINLILGLTKLYEIANSMTVETIECPVWVHRFLIGKNDFNLQEIIEDNEKVIFRSISFLFLPIWLQSNYSKNYLFI